LQVFQRGDFFQAELRPEKESWNNTISGRRDPADPIAFSGLAVAGAEVLDPATAGTGQRHRAEGG
jgi:hypothetical protein